MATLKSLIYLSHGNLPSQWAHSIQIAKMAQALSQKVDDFELVTRGDIWSICKGMDTEFQRWYNLQDRYKLIRLPVHLQDKSPFPSDSRSELYYRLAAIYGSLRESSLIYTRAWEFVDLFLKSGKPVLLETHEPIREDSFFPKYFKDKNLIGVVTISPKLAENYIQLGLDPNKILIAHCAVDINNFLPEQEKELARQKIHLPLDAKIIVYAGHLYDSKGIPTVLNTARMMPEYTFVLLGGWANDINKVKEDCQKKDLRNVYVIGHLPQSELVSYLYAADILIVPTSKSWFLAESTSPLKLFEYMAVRKPIVASALPNIMTILRDGENALLAEPDNPLSFQEAIVNLFQNPLLATSIAERAFQEVQNFSWDNRANQVLQFALERLQERNNSTSDEGKNLMRYLRTIWLAMSSDLDFVYQERIKNFYHFYQPNA